MTAEVDKLKTETRGAGLLILAAGYIQTGQKLPAKVVRAIRFQLRGYP